MTYHRCCRLHKAIIISHQNGCFISGFPQGPGPWQGVLAGLPSHSPPIYPFRPLCSSPQPSDLANGVNENASGTPSHTTWPALDTQSLSFTAFPSPLGLSDPLFPLKVSGLPPIISCTLHTTPNMPKPSLTSPHMQLSPCRNPQREEGPAFCWKLFL